MGSYGPSILVTMEKYSMIDEKEEKTLNDLLYTKFREVRNNIDAFYERKNCNNYHSFDT
jgi:hypothetical protein